MPCCQHLILGGHPLGQSGLPFEVTFQLSHELTLRERKRDSIKVLEALIVHHSYNYMTILSDVERKQCRDYRALDCTRPESRQLTREHGDINKSTGPCDRPQAH